MAKVVIILEEDSKTKSIRCTTNPPASDIQKAIEDPNSSMLYDYAKNAIEAILMTNAMAEKFKEEDSIIKKPRSGLLLP